MSWVWRKRSAAFVDRMSEAINPERLDRLRGQVDSVPDAEVLAFFTHLNPAVIAFQSAVRARDSVAFRFDEYHHGERIHEAVSPTGRAEPRRGHPRNRGGKALPPEFAQSGVEPFGVGTPTPCLVLDCSHDLTLHPNPVSPLKELAGLVELILDLGIGMADYGILHFCARCHERWLSVVTRSEDIEDEGGNVVLTPRKSLKMGRNVHLSAESP